jgi:hypothetical protein
MLKAFRLWVERRMGLRKNSSCCEGAGLVEGVTWIISFFCEINEGPFARLGETSEFVSVRDNRDLFSCLRYPNTQHSSVTNRRHWQIIQVQAAQLEQADYRYLDIGLRWVVSLSISFPSSFNFVSSNISPSRHAETPPSTAASLLQRSSSILRSA